MIQFYPNFEHVLRESLRSVVGKEAEEKVEIGMAKDGSGVGGLSYWTVHGVHSNTDTRYPCSRSLRPSSYEARPIGAMFPCTPHRNVDVQHTGKQ